MGQFADFLTANKILTGLSDQSGNEKQTVHFNPTNVQETPGANIINYGLFAVIYGTQLLVNKKLRIMALSTDVYV